MRKSQVFMNVMTLFAVLVSVVFISCGALFENGQSGNVTINLPPVSSQTRAISSDKIGGLKNATASYRVIVEANGGRTEKSGGGGSYSFFVPLGANIEVTVECLNSSGEVIVRARKTHNVTAGTNNVNINLSQDGDEVGTGGGNPPAPPAPQPVTGKVTYDGGTGASNVPSDTQTYETGNEVTLQAGEPTRAGYTFAGWTSNVALEATDASGRPVPITQSTAFASTSSTAQGVTTKITSFKMPEGGVVLTAKWTPITYNITYNDTNGGTGSADTANATTSFNIETQSITLAAEGTLEKIAYQFDGWETSDGRDVRGMNAAQLIALITSGDTLTLRAKWIDGKRTVLYDDGKFIINELPANRRNDVGVTQEYAAMKDDGSNYVFNIAYDVLWDQNKNLITSVEIGSSISPTSTATWFAGMPQCVSMNLTNLNTSNVTNMCNMFHDLKVISLDVSRFDTSNVTDMNNMFMGCSELTSLDVSRFDTSNVTDMNNMFGGCSELTSLDLSSFNTSNVTDMSIMFGGCSKLTSLDVSDFDTSNVTDMGSMFYYCSGLTSLDVSKFDTSNVTQMSSMFGGCSELTSLDLSSFNTSNVTDMRGMFQNCPELTSLDLSGFNTYNVTYMNDMFSGCSKLERIYVGDNFPTNKAMNNSSMMFYNCTALVGGSGTTYAASNPTDSTYAHIDDPDNGNPGYFTAKP